MKKGIIFIIISLVVIIILVIASLAIANKNNKPVKKEETKETKIKIETPIEDNKEKEVIKEITPVKKEVEKKKVDTPLTNETISYSTIFEEIETYQIDLNNLTEKVN